MKLYITPGSPYARMARIMVLEKRLEDRAEVILAQTRSVDSPYYRINPSGRVPYLLRDDGVGLEESAVICRYLDHFDGRPEFDLPTGDQAWEPMRLRALATSLMDGLSVWLRETKRPAGEQSPTTIHHEIERAKRLVDHWGDRNRSPQDAREPQPRAGHTGLRSWARGAHIVPLARGSPEASRLVRQHWHAPIACEDGSADWSLIEEVAAQTLIIK